MINNDNEFYSTIKIYNYNMIIIFILSTIYLKYFFLLL